MISGRFDVFYFFKQKTAYEMLRSLVGSEMGIRDRPSDVTAIEKSGSFPGVYHVLLGAISPLEGKGPGDLKIDTLLSRIKQLNIKEIIIATDADTEGEATALYLTKLIKPLGVRLSRIGLGLPVGSNLEYADSTTLSKSLEARRVI